MTDSAEKKIIVGVREDGSLYFDVEGEISPHEAIGMTRWLQIALESNMERQHMIGSGGTLEAMKGLLADTRTFQGNLLKSHQTVLKALGMSTKGMMDVFQLIKKIAETDDKEEKQKE